MNQQKRLAMSRWRRKMHVRSKARLQQDRPRLSIYRSNKYIYAQIIDDFSSKTLCSASSKEKDLSSLKSGGNKEAAAAVGKLLGARAQEAGVTQVAFDRREYKYHGRVAALADAAREAGLKF
ncbi:LSU ribosomal protein L18P [Planctomycetales bacterium 10988]|nr:LSU ribosomal protein L18P [Planctomycetales bacterium 10988]